MFQTVRKYVVAAIAVPMALAGITLVVSAVVLGTLGEPGGNGGNVHKGRA